MLLNVMFQFSQFLICFSQLLVTVCLVSRLLASLFQETLNHIRDHCLDLGERILACASPLTHHTRNLCSQLREARRVLLVGQFTNEIDHLEVGKVLNGVQAKSARVAPTAIHL